MMDLQPSENIRMSGTFQNFVETERGIYYRLFNEAEINAGGAFYNL